MRKLKVIEYDPAWPDLFACESALIKDTLDNVIIRIHHIGSTAVQGLPAKPIIDILAEVTELALLDALSDNMIAIGYEPKGEFGIPGRRYFQKGGNEHTHHIHAFVSGDFNVTRHISFRDYLRSNPVVARAYGELKKNIAMTCNNDIEIYCDKKRHFIKYFEAISLGQNPPIKPLNTVEDDPSFSSSFIHPHSYF